MVIWYISLKKRVSNPKKIDNYFEMQSTLHYICHRLKQSLSF
ncbi:hypothetical protein ABIC45_004652 [Mucilaginibacter rubeus]